MYYHVVVRTKLRGKKYAEEFVLFDLEDENEVISLYVDPYANGKDLIFEGNTVENKEIQDFLISCSEVPAQQLLDLFYEINKNPIFGTTKKNIVKDYRYAKEITVDLLRRVENGEKILAEKFLCND